MSEPAPVLRLEALPEDHDTPQLADYVELLSIANADREFSSADLLDRWRERDDLGETEVVDAALVDEPEAFQEPPVGEPARVADWQIGLTDDVFRHLAYRARAFGDGYPFELPTPSVLARRPALTDEHRLYVFLLLAASQSYVRRSERPMIRTAFERLVADVLRSLLPRADVHVFGTAAQEGERFHGGNLYARVTRLAEDLAEENKIDPEDVSKHNAGDGGLDVVAWIPTGDRAPAPLTFLAQAATGAEWLAKQQQASADLWANRISQTARPLGIMCIPYCWRKTDGGWARQHDLMASSVLFDRVRVMAALSGSGRLPSVPYDLVDDALNFVEPAV